MDWELYRQLVHLGGVLFVILAQFVGKTITGVYLIVFSAFFLLYSEYIRREEKRLGLLAQLERKLRNIALHLETRPKKSFMGAFWFYFSCGIVFLIFPLNIASASCAILAIGDSLSTIFGNKFGKHRIAGRKTIEGSVAFLIGSFIGAFFFLDYTAAVFVSVLAAIIELIPGMQPLQTLAKKGIVDDNWMVPILTAVFITVIYL